jgi:hypothetical protein
MAAAGKFVRDHVFDPKKRDVQFGCAPLLAVTMAIDPLIAIEGLKEAA